MNHTFYTVCKLPTLSRFSKYLNIRELRNQYILVFMQKSDIYLFIHSHYPHNKQQLSPQTATSWLMERQCSLWEYEFINIMQKNFKFQRIILKFNPQSPQVSTSILKSYFSSEFGAKNTGTLNKLQKKNYFQSLSFLISFASVRPRQVHS